MTRRADRPRSGNSPVLDGSRTGDPRSRHSNAAGLSEADVEAPLAIRDGRATLLLDSRGPLQRSPQGTVVLNLGPGMEVVTGSPPRLQARVSESIVTGPDGRLRARVAATDVQGFARAVSAVATPIAVEKAAEAVAATPPAPPIVAFRTGTITVTVLDTALVVTFATPMPNTGYQVFLQPKASVAVQSWPSTFNTTDFTLNLSAGVAADFAYLAIGVP